MPLHPAKQCSSVCVQPLQADAPKGKQLTPQPRRLHLTPFALSFQTIRLSATVCLLPFAGHRLLPFPHSPSRCRTMLIMYSFTNDWYNSVSSMEAENTEPAANGRRKM